MSNEQATPAELKAYAIWDRALVEEGGPLTGILALCLEPFTSFKEALAAPGGADFARRALEEFYND